MPEFSPRQHRPLVQTSAVRAETPLPSVRQATPLDIPALMHLKREMAIAEGSERLVDASAADWVLDGFGPQPRFAAFVAECENTVVGMIIYGERRYAGWARPSFYVQDIYVEPRHRRQGIGRALLARVSVQARALNAAMIELHVHTGNTARRFYDQIGFQAQPQCLAYTLWGPALSAFTEASQTDPE